MTISADLMGLGLPPALANALGGSAGALNAAGTSSTTATAIGQLRFVNLTTASSQTGASLPSDAPLWTPIVVCVITATTAVIFPHSGAQLNYGTATTGGQNVAQNKTAIYWRTGALTWMSVLTA